jgi:hypothetical protein
MDAMDGVSCADARNRAHPSVLGGRDRVGIAGGLGGGGFAVEAETGGAVGIGAEGADVGLLEFGEYFGTGMAEMVAEAAGDDGPLRGDAGEELGPGGSKAAVMAHFEQGAGEVGSKEHGLFNGRFGIAFEEDRCLSIGEAQDQRIVIHGGRSGLISASGGEDGDMSEAELRCIACKERACLEVQVGGLTEERVVGGEMWIVADPQLGGVEIAEDGGQAVHVIGMSVAERDGIEVADAARPESRRDHFFADVEFGGG